jgi:transcriptional regulator with XRE-family HTH domain
MSQNGYSRLERDDADISLSRLMQIAQVLETSLMELIDFDENKLLFTQTSHDTSNGVIFQQTLGLAENKRKQYESRITDLQKEIDYLRGMLEKTLTK